MDSHVQVNPFSLLILVNNHLKNEADNQYRSIPADAKELLIWLNIDAMRSKCFPGTDEATYRDYNIRGEYI